MKNTFLLIALTFIYFGAFAQETQVTPKVKTPPPALVPENALYIQPFHFFVSQFKISYERMYDNRKKAFMGTAGFYLKNINEFSNERNTSVEFLSTGFNMELQNKFFLLSNVTQQKTMTKTYNSFLMFYTAPFAKYNNYNLKGLAVNTVIITDSLGFQYEVNVEEEYADKINSFSGGVVFGFKWVFMDRLALDLQAGGGAKYSSVTPQFEGSENTYNNTPFSKGYTGVFPTMNAQLGIAF